MSENGGGTETRGKSVNRKNPGRMSARVHLATLLNQLNYAETPSLRVS